MQHLKVVKNKKLNIVFFALVGLILLMAFFSINNNVKKVFAESITISDKNMANFYNYSSTASDTRLEEDNFYCTIPKNEVNYKGVHSFRFLEDLKTDTYYTISAYVETNIPVDERSTVGVGIYLIDSNYNYVYSSPRTTIIKNGWTSLTIKTPSTKSWDIKKSRLQLICGWNITHSIDVSIKFSQIQFEENNVRTDYELNKLVALTMYFGVLNPTYIGYNNLGNWKTCSSIIENGGIFDIRDLEDNFIDIIEIDVVWIYLDLFEYSLSFTDIANLKSATANLWNNWDYNYHLREIILNTTDDNVFQLIQQPSGEYSDDFSDTAITNWINNNFYYKENRYYPKFKYKILTQECLDNLELRNIPLFYGRAFNSYTVYCDGLPNNYEKQFSFNDFIYGNMLNTYYTLDYFDGVAEGYNTKFNELDKQILDLTESFQKEINQLRTSNNFYAEKWEAYEDGMDFKGGLQGMINGFFNSVKDTFNLTIPFLNVNLWSLVSFILTIAIVGFVISLLVGSRR